MVNSTPSLTIVQVLLMLASAGGFGGLVQFLFSLGDFYLDNSHTSLHWKHGKNFLGAFLFGAALVTAVLVGIAGSLGAWFVITAANKFPDIGKLENQLYVFGLSVVAGFGSRQLLPSITATFQQQLNRLGAQNIELQTQAAKSAARVNAISRAQTALASTTTPPAERVSAAQALSALELPTDRTVALLQGRLYRVNAEHGPAADRDAQYGQAIAALNSFLQAKGATRDTDYADALYNRACYKCLRNGYQDLQQALNDLRESVGISAANKALARDDHDLDNLRNDPQLGPQFTQLVAA